MSGRGKIVTVTLNPAIDKTVTVESFQYGGLNRIKSGRTDAGGKGINVAKVLASFRMNVSAIGIAAGYQGQLVRDMLKDQSIPCYLLEAAGDTRVNLKVVDESTQQTTEINEPGFYADGELLEQFKEHFITNMAGASLLVLAGSLPPGTPPGYYGTLINLARKHGVDTLLDADGEALALGIEAAPLVIKPNIHELEVLMGQRLESLQQITGAARSLLSRGIRYVLVSMGENGSVLVSQEKAVRASPFPITPLSTVGAGDSMVAALAYSIMMEKTAEEMARWTSAAGTVTASKPGTEVCTMSEIEEAIHKVELTEIMER